MRTTSLLTLALLGTVSVAHADDTNAARAAASSSGHRHFGLTIDVGVPDGANAALVFRPVRPLRLHAGVGHNGISQGMRAGVTLVPLATWLSPTLSLDIGRYPEGDANPLVRMATGDTSFSSPSLERVGYRYANAHFGLELGRERATFYLHAGMSRLVGNLRHLAESTGDEMASVTFEEDPVVTITSVSARIGLIVYL